MNLFFKLNRIAVLFLFSSFVLTSCQKEITEQTNRQSPPTASSAVQNTSSCSNVTYTFHGIDITYLADQEMLMFSSGDDVNEVLKILDNLYEEHNASYEEQYPELTEEELDALDEETGFDEFQSFKEFESQFSFFVSKRSELEAIENAWLESDFTELDPDSVDYTFDDAENTIFNNQYRVMIGETRYELRNDGLYDIDNETGPLRISHSYRTTEECKSNKNLKEPFEYSTGKFHLKVAINSWFIRSGAKGKVVSYKLKDNGKFKRSRAKLAVFIGGTIYDNTCSNPFTFSERNPLTGYKKRRQLKQARHKVGTIWKTKQNELVACFDNNNIYNGCLPLTW